jgi:hypothetical protein
MSTQMDRTLPESSGEGVVLLAYILMLFRTELTKTT